MTRLISKGLMLGLLLGGATLARADDGAELRAKARAVQKAADALAEAGDAKTADHLRAQAQEILREAERREASPKREASSPEAERELGRLKEHLQDLRVKLKAATEAQAPERDLAQIREAIGRVERELRTLGGKLAEGRSARPELEAQARRFEEAGRRIRHLRAAAENLKAAEVHDLAMKLMEQAEAMERDVAQAKERFAAEMKRQGGSDPREAEIRELRERNERLSAEIRELRAKLEKR